jgi:hypothetical protein
MEATLMKPSRFINKALLLLLLGIPAFAYAKNGPKEKGEDGQKKQQEQHADNNRGNNGNHYGRISDDHYRANFGRSHAFRMNKPKFIDGYHRFQYSGYLFGYKQRWPSGWNYNDDVYVDFVGGAYLMYNPRHPGIHVTLSLF